MKVRITGGAGYIGSTVASAFADAGDQVALLDDLSSGSRVEKTVVDAVRAAVRRQARAC